MLVIYTSPGCASCRKATHWLKEKAINYVEKNIFNSLLKESELKYILARSENGIDDIISKRSKIIREQNIDIDSMSTSELIDFVRNNPSTMKRPIMIDERNFLVGYDEEEIEAFDVRNIRKHLQSECPGQECPSFDTCGKLREDYQFEG